eukprot:snap_masked-scaffold_25-processed-gene-2.55-mRNA-1 protein AED:1.00 eAED:1.00 QI:0/-1/0/0/-1/1/1/0/673
MNFLFTFLKTLLLLSVTRAQFELFSDIQYGEEERNFLDLYIPTSNSFQGQHPLVLFIHGGRWLRGDKSQVLLYNRINAMTSNGLAVASINWQYSSTAIWPAQLNDVIAALDFLTEEETSTTYGLDVSKISLWGQSSGAHMALMASFSASELTQLNLKISSVVSWYAPSDLYHIYTDRISDDVEGTNFDAEPEEQLVGATRVIENKQVFDEASPLFVVNNTENGVKLPVENLLIVHGDSDGTISPLQSERLYNGIVEQGGYSSLEYRVVEGGEHGGDAFEAETFHAVSFLAGSMGSQKPNYDLISDIAYGEPDRQNLSLYLATSTPEGYESNPLVLYIHGGAWFRGSNAQVLDYNRAQEITGRGFSVAAMNWRYSSTDSWPAQRDDVIDALDFLVENSEIYNLNVSKVAIWGQSSGAHQALFGGLLAEELTEANVEIAGTVAWFPPSSLMDLPTDRLIDFAPGPDYTEFTPAEDPMQGEPEEMLLNLSLTEENRDSFEAASPVFWINAMDRGTPTCDFLILHGTADDRVSPVQTWRLFHALEDQGGAQNLNVRLIEENGHGGDDFFDETIPSLDFISQSFGLGEFDWADNNDDIDLILRGVETPEYESDEDEVDEEEEEDNDVFYEDVTILQIALAAAALVIMVLGGKIACTKQQYSVESAPLRKENVLVKEVI